MQYRFLKFLVVLPVGILCSQLNDGMSEDSMFANQHGIRTVYECVYPSARSLVRELLDESMRFV
jgi:hypothetical protein